MLHIDDSGNISLTRGDTARLTVPITNEADGKEYAMQPGDTLTLTVKKSARDAEYMIQKVVHGGNAFHIAPQDTSHLAFGRYKYDVQLATAGGDVYTVAGPFNFNLTEEVTW